MDKQDTKELSMDEILSSIRNILHDSGARHQSKDDEYRAINISTMKTVAEPQPFVPLRPVVSEPQVSEATEEKNDTEYDVATICSNIQKMMLQAEEREEQNNNFRITTDDEEIYEPKDNLSEQIVKDFADIFASRHQNEKVADISVQKLAEVAIINEVVPILSQWLEDCLPNLVRKEVERVMVKTGKR